MPRHVTDALGAFAKTDTANQLVAAQRAAGHNAGGILCLDAGRKSPRERNGMGLSKMK